MNKETSKKAFREAEKELEENQVKKLKEVIKKTLKRIDDVEKAIKELQEEKKILKLDIEDLKEGRLDRIEERQKKDKKAKEVSVVEVKKEVHHHHHYDRWYEPYRITFVEKPQRYFPTVYCRTQDSGQSPDVFGQVTSGNLSSSFCGTSFTLDNSVAKNNVIGTYLIEDKTIHLR